MTGALLWTCAACREPVADGDGYLQVLASELRKVEQYWAGKEIELHTCPGQFPKVTCLSVYQDAPADARWRAWHKRCDPEPDGGAYWANIERVRTHAMLLDWTAHLMQKRWLRYTDWHNLIRRMAAIDA